MNNNTLEPTWQPIAQLPISIPENIRMWLMAEVSLTEKLRELGNFSVKVWQEGWSSALPSENKILDIDSHMLVWQRDVILLVNNVPVGIGHTVIPEATIKVIPQLLELGNHSLGDLIFHDLHGKREKLEFACLSADSPHQALYIMAKQFYAERKNQLWCRRSLLVAKNQKLLVNEVFLPNLTNRAEGE